MNARTWPMEGDARVPYWVYTDETIYRRQLERIFEGPTWNRLVDAALIPGSIVMPL